MSHRLRRISHKPKDCLLLAATKIVLMAASAFTPAAPVLGGEQITIPAAVPTSSRTSCKSAIFKSIISTATPVLVIPWAIA